jgi:uncharacterized protein (UPF0147 family)
MDRLDVLYNIVRDNNKPVTERTEAISGIVGMHLTNDVMKVLSTIATDTTLPFKVRQMASDRLIKK